MKDKKKILRELGFHHSYGVWISDTDSNIRIKLESHGDRVCFKLTNHGNTYTSNNFFWFSKTKDDHEVIKVKLLERLLEWV